MNALNYLILFFTFQSSKLRHILYKKTQKHLWSKFGSAALALMHQDQEPPMMTHRKIFELLTIVASYCFVVEEFINLLIKTDKTIE